MRRLALLLTLLVLTCSGSALAAGNTLTCSISPSGVGCFVERPVFTLGSLEVAFGVDARAVWGAGSSYLAPYAIVGWYEDEWAAWVEFALSDARVPVFGKPDAIRAGFTVRF